ncbi:hypothetical protein F53441_4667 [Fusarium austroafricanum]|uniref:Methyltransferase domain-containing protein n=1 Tax=Fusarium austroafricanum TaxID=2364996 RepID=A0A8H4P1H8_9HYPO|nr:hypothetical protein F53441_4667 [Fusarium austroafricanum]
MSLQQSEQQTSSLETASEPVIQLQDAIPAANDGDTDSSIGEETGSSTVSISSSVLAYRKENGRSYHALSDGTDEHPKAEVIGVDLSPIQPAFVPPNLTFEVDDLEKDWTWTQKFDFIFGRMMLGSFADLPRIIQVAFDNLEPGGYLELQDMSPPARSDDDTLLPDSYLSRWCNYCFEAGQKLGRPIFPTTEYKNYLAAAGFENIVEVQQKWPTNPWPRDRKFKDLGAWSYANIASGLDGLSLAYFTRGLGWTPEETRVFCAHTRKDIQNPKIHAYWPIYFVYGRKPLTG